MRKKNLLRGCSILVALSLLIGLNLPKFIRATDTQQVENIEMVESPTETTVEEPVSGGEILETNTFSTETTVNGETNAGSGTGTLEILETALPTTDISSVEEATGNATSKDSVSEIAGSSKEEVSLASSSTPVSQETSKVETISALDVASATPYATLSSWMPDENLQLKIAETLGITVAEITETTLTGLTSFSAPNSGIINLKGLEKAIHLTTLDLSGNWIFKADLSALTALQDVRINNNRLIEVNLTGLTQLVNLDLTQNKLPTLILDNLTALNSLTVTNNKITALDLTNLPNLQIIEAQNNLLTGLILENLPQLLSVDFQMNLLTSITLKDLPLLQTVSLYQNKIYDLRNIQQLNTPSIISLNVQSQIINSQTTMKNTAILLPEIINTLGNPIVWVIPGVVNVNYTLSGGNITWLTSGSKMLTINHNSGAIAYSIAYNNIIIDSTTADGWNEISYVSGNTGVLITNYFSRNGLDFKVESGVLGDASISKLNENNTIYNLTTGQTYTYAFSRGSGYYSNMWYKEGAVGTYKDVGLISGISPRIFVYHDSVTGKEKLRKVYENTTAGLEVIITTEVTDAGAIKHVIEVTNKTGATRTNLGLLARIDTQLNQDDSITLYANGSGGVYMKADGIVLYGEPLAGTTRVYAGHYNNTSQANFDNETNNVGSTFGKAADAILALNVDSGMYFGPAFQDLEPDEKITFSYQERIFSDAEPEPEPENAITVQYQDTEGTDLETPTILTGTPGTAYTTTQKTFTDYDFVQVIGTANGNFTYEPQTITYVYDVSNGADITVHYQDEEGNTLFPSVTLEGKLQASYTCEQKTIAGYTFVRVEGTATGVFGHAAIVVTYIYEVSNGADVTVKYQDTEGNTLSPDVVLQGKLGASYACEDKAITGYNFLRVDGAATGTFSAIAQTVICVYQSSVTQVSLGKVIVRYLDSKGVPLNNDVELAEAIGTPYKIEAKIFKGYEVEEVLGAVEGTFKSTPITITFVYKSSNTLGVSGGEIVVRYQDESGNLLAEEVYLKGNVDDTYVADQKTFSGFSFVRVEGEAKGIFGVDQKTVIYHYKKALVETVGGVNNTTTPPPTTNAANTGSKTLAGALSKTGESGVRTVSMAWGLMALATGLAGVILYKKKKMNSHI